MTAARDWSHCIHSQREMGAAAHLAFFFPVLLCFIYVHHHRHVQVHVLINARREPQVSYLKSLGFWARSLTGTWGLWMTLNWPAWESVYLCHPGRGLASMYLFYMKSWYHIQHFIYWVTSLAFAFFLFSVGPQTLEKMPPIVSEALPSWIKPCWKHPQDIHRGLFPVGILNRHTLTSRLAGMPYE